PSARHPRTLRLDRVGAVVCLGGVRRGLTPFARAGSSSDADVRASRSAYPLTADRARVASRAPARRSDAPVRRCSARRCGRLRATAASGELTRSPCVLRAPRQCRSVTEGTVSFSVAMLHRSALAAVALRQTTLRDTPTAVKSAQL